MFKFKKIPADVVAAATVILTKYNNKEIHCRYTNGKEKHRILDVDYRYRLMNKGNYWELLSHEKYNKKLNR